MYQKCSILCVFREMQIKTTMSYYYISIRMVKPQNNDNTKCWWGYEATGTHLLLMELEMEQPLWKTTWQFLKKTKHSLTIWANNLAPQYFLWEAEKFCPHRNLHMNVYSSFTHSYQNLEETKMSFSRWMDK